MPHQILIAEDDSNILISLNFLLRNAGYAVSTAANGQLAWSSLQAQPTDLVVLDVMLPIVDGLEVCRRIRATPGLRATRVLMLSARGRSTEIDAGLRLGADAYMTKPFATRDFLDTVARLLKPPGNPGA